MPLKTAEKTINKAKYLYAMQPLTPATEMLSLVTALVSEPLAALLGGLGSVDSLMDLGGAPLERIVQALLAKLGASTQMLDLIKRCNKGGMVQGPKGLLDLSDEAVAEEYFRERFGDVVPWVAFALETQLGPFFGSVTSSFGSADGKLSTLMEMAKKFASRTQSSGAGTSSESSPSESQP